MAGDVRKIGAGAEGMGDGVRLTNEQLVQLRAKTVAFHNERTDIVFTCDDCAAATECEFVFDPYNTDGDCLAEK